MNENEKPVGLLPLAEAILETLRVRYFEQDVYEYLPATGVHTKRSAAWLQAAVLAVLREQHSGFAVTAAFLNNLITIIRALAYTEESITAPFWIDERTPANVLLLSNGVLRLDHGCRDGRWTLEPFTPGLFDVGALPFPYDPAAGCPRWLDFLDWMVGRDAAVVEMIRQFTASALITPRIKLERFLWLVGGGRNGKSTAFAVLRHVLGETATSALGLNAFSGAENFRLWSILHRRANFCADASVDRRADMAALNAFTSGDPVAVNRKFREHVVVEPSTILFFASNADPLVNDPSDAFWRRLLLVRCEQRLADSEVNPTLVNDLKAEAPGILNWLLEAIPRLIEAKAIDIPVKVRHDVAELQAQVNGFRIFAAEEIDAGGPECFISREELMQEFEGWSNRNHMRRDDVVTVTSEMNRIFGSKLHRRRKGPRGTRVKGFSCVRWRPETTPDGDPGVAVPAMVVATVTPSAAADGPDDADGNQPAGHTDEAATVAALAAAPSTEAPDVAERGSDATSIDDAEFIAMVREADPELVVSGLGEG